MAWLVRQIVDLFNSLAAWYYRRKYGAAAKRLGRLPDEEVDDRRGFIALEIDGLGHDYLLRALEQGDMPYLGHLVRDGSYRLARWRCGLPSTTPAAQAGILYGNNWDIPGFRWYDKASGASVMCKLPGSVRAVQERISTGRVGLLRGGSSYTNMFDGDARLALFTLGSLGGEYLFENVRGLGFVILFALSPLRIVRVIALSLWTWLVYVARRLAAFFRPGRSHFVFLGSLYEIANNVIFREITTFSIMLDIYRGMPSVYASYTGYDEIAHHFGADSRQAFRALRGLDKQIRQIDRMRRLYVRREYDLYILSDHGMTPSLPFRQAYGQTLEQLIAIHTGLEVRNGEAADDGEGLAAGRLRYLAAEIQHIESRQRRELPARLLRATRQRLEERLPPDSLEIDWDLSRRTDIAIRSSGSLSHIYFEVTPQQMELSEVALLYPTLLDILIRHEGIGLVAGRDGEKVVVVGKAGSLWIGPDGSQLEGKDPLAGLPDPAWAADQLARLARFPHAGDLILLGAWDDKRVISFEEQAASHGGLGGGQNSPFIAGPSQALVSTEGIRGAEEVYGRLAGVYGESSRA
ncbi:MAG: alkaline phosphatase family protein [Anaerolineae bacterium]|nr:alkaline phosphatase family protein [Anaerolineae bacterium]